MIYLTVYIACNVILLMTCKSYTTKKYAEIFVFLTGAILILSHPHVGDVVHYENGFVNGGYLGGRQDYLWHLSQKLIFEVVGANGAVAAYQVITILLFWVVIGAFRAMPIMICSSIAILVTQNGLRQGISGILISAMGLSSNWLKPLVLSIFGGFVHTSGIAFFGILLFYRCLLLIKYKHINKLLVFIVIISPIAVYFMSNALTYLGYDGYIRNDIVMDNRVTGAIKYVAYFLDVMLTLAVISAFSRCTSSNTELQSVSYTICTLYLLSIAVVVIYGAHDLASRIFFFHNILVTMALGFIIVNLKTNYYYNKLYVAVNIIFFGRNLVAINAIKLLLMD